MELEINALPALRDNYIWALAHAQKAVLVDPGEAAPALRWLRARACALEAILITHHHADHQGGVRELLAHYPQARIFGPGRESITACSNPLSGGERLPLLGLELEVLDVAAHTRGHLAYRLADALFCGDTLFGGGCGKLFEGTAEDMLAALDKIAALPDETRIFCAHEYTVFCLTFALTHVEPDNAVLQARLEEAKARRAAGLPTVPSTLALEKATNPFLRLSAPQVAASVRRRAPHALAPAAILSVLLEWLDEQ
jgi:hydroxyacylglutathione hydrolase